MAKKITMQDIANELNISKNSVSQALSGKDGVSESTRKLVVDTAKKLGYIYASSRTNENDKISGNIGLIASDFAFSQKSFFGEIYLSVEKEVKQGGMNLIIESVDNHAIENLILPDFINKHSVSGLLILSHISTDYINLLIDTGIPVVMIDHHHPFNKADAVLLNNRFSAYRAIHFLIELGHNDIGFIGNTSISPSYQERFEGYRLALDHYNLPLHQDFMITDIIENSESVAETLQQLNKFPTAWFCINDGLGFLTQTHMINNGYNVPEDISIFSFDNGQLSRIAQPTTSTVDINFPLYGRRAVEQLFWRIQHPTEPIQEILLDSTIIERESTGRRKV
ncbi:DNA-binding transcriptional regulator [Gracilibacillus boraciitolerans JCM 21714]|uniref:DNA-binding transcriptional regulator n=1 Tax=Gracilibacillus boraciitolerans JCM 21714 TaxID=1298598 RepID=W4VM41_9BACI|nr:LacI family DNA-binding transcriptional regulator [Gracilibacillus boraciitolerans]GAE93893.1 DNA-binding transcriptional regulator [Gracilibacillus boraciitolerans JCM 21714]